MGELNTMIPITVLFHLRRLCSDCGNKDKSRLWKLFILLFVSYREGWKIICPWFRWSSHSCLAFCFNELWMSCTEMKLFLVSSCFPNTSVPQSLAQIRTSSSIRYKLLLRAKDNGLFPSRHSLTQAFISVQFQNPCFVLFFPGLHVSFYQFQPLGCLMLQNKFRH